MLENLTTETRNEKTMNLDGMSTIDFLTVMNEEDAKVAGAVKQEIPQIAKAVEAIIAAKRKGGRLIYIGAGTSGRIGLLDAVECPPTFGTNPEEVIGLIAGGENAFIKAVEGAEDNKELGIQDLKDIKLTKKDIVVGIAASGRTPYVIGGLEYANSLGASTVAICCNKNSAAGKVADIAIEVVSGPEVLTGSTRLKSGTSQKLICNMLSTASMVGIGKVYGNLMVDVQLTNEKLVERAKRIIMEATSCDYETAEIYLEQADHKPKVAIVMILAGLTKEEAIRKLEEAQGFVRQAIK
ncbi:N-acetylmuramic acid 6-phosphate etherase MurQ [Paenibacillus larvae subsp. larvae]|uniref:N-acetylmuramic acid 6-phosphate etherase n=2 Tax=Paenibacillus larvae subsp. larvae TaxID=147375 RepID=V9WAU6_9BACL|nr:N-acetylmuramic acid 6-phosphate etherase [Paenibacillus larvae]AHD07009.1 N-acetylmuramic acid 6-phosphate etherase MurQ [Paenibacillus larvae subsp. larvae DSM 25430]AQZ47784.1 N-acetylmuramic acid 6-phosphate etherase [Paenibacillus larvae subsp. pulvifaciens]AVF25668.1 N-acetylmuramic acid 6-phosphate etherase MurQ [Paenibacillus larvae subsp. larvae]AVF30445.1 N-acetylmuramic acid 6-phosphate etherase MurQ [Paenibacillus larvae subsp. larvae]AVG13573.1 N-acetylmuramic acid 6-phosphate 